MKKKSVVPYVLIVIAAFLVHGFASGYMQIRGSAFIVPVTQDLGISISSFSLTQTIFSIIGIVAMPFYSKLMMKFSAKRILLICMTVYASSFLLYSLTEQLWQLYLFCVIGAVASPALLTTITIIVNNWFRDKRGLANGIFSTGSGVMGAILLPVLVGMIAQNGWRFGYTFMGILALLVAVPMIALVVKSHPSERGLEPYTSEADRAKQAAAVQPANLITHSVPYKTAVKSPSFFLLMFALFVAAVVTFACQLNTSPYLISLGYSEAFAASILSGYMITMVVAKISLGWVFDKFSPYIGAIIGSAAAVLSVVCLMLVPYSSAFAWLYAIFLGIVGSSFAVSGSILLPIFFGYADFRALFPYVVMIANIGTAVGVPLVGFLFDSTGSYSVSWILLTVLGVLGLICIVVSIKKAEKYKSEYSNSTV